MTLKKFQPKGNKIEVLVKSTAKNSAQKSVKKAKKRPYCNAFENVPYKMVPITLSNIISERRQNLIGHLKKLFRNAARNTVRNRNR